MLIDHHIADGTNNIAEGPAMTDEQAYMAIEAGIRLVKDCADQGYTILATGEMGIGNTTTSSAVASILLHSPVAEVTGRGAGLSDSGLLRKISVIEKAIKVNQPDPDDAYDILRKLGGFDIAGMTGIFLGGALYRIPIVIDGIISAVSALIAMRLCPESRHAMLASHVSDEPAGRMLLDALNLRPLITAEMRLGEGTGAVASFPLLDMALCVYHGSSSFSDIGLEAYRPL
jgi:nicotinate-nucleotide--dimethylbenzimidazole phosphoribosyltransferase